MDDIEFNDTDEAELGTPMLMVGDEAPNFTAESTKGLIEFHEVARDKWTLLITLPKLQHPVVASQVAKICELAEEFQTRDLQVYAVAMDTKMSVRIWLSEIEDILDKKLPFPIVIDDKGFIAKALGLVRPNERNFIRALVPAVLSLVVDPFLAIQLYQNYPLSIGHNFYEILRAVDSVKLSSNHRICTPANWSSDEEVLIQPHLNILEAAEEFVKGFLEVRPWFRITATPDDDDNE